MKHPTCRVVAYQMNACAKGDLFSDANVQSEGLIPDATSHMGLKRHGLGRGSLLDTLLLNMFSKACASRPNIGSAHKLHR